MIFTLIIGLLLGAISVIFITQNTTLITVNFLTYELESSLALVIIGSILMGLMVAMIFSLPTIIKDHRKFSLLKKQNRELEKSYKDAQGKVATFENRNELIDKHLDNTN